jgi:hypothetical protein
VKKPTLIKAKGAGVIVAPSIDKPRGVFDMQHFVVKNIFHEPLWNIFGVECFANGYAVVDMIVMTQDVSRPTLRPRYGWFADLTLEVLPIQLGKHPIEIIDLALSG